VKCQAAEILGKDHGIRAGLQAAEAVADGVVSASWIRIERDRDVIGVLRDRGPQAPVGLLEAARSAAVGRALHQPQAAAPGVCAIALNLPRRTSSEFLYDRGALWQHPAHLVSSGPQTSSRTPCTAAQRSLVLPPDPHAEPKQHMGVG
jgi:hypothetical protein